MKAAEELKSLLGRHPALKVAAAESLTCGRIQSLIGSVTGSSAYFVGGITAYSLAQKAAHLGVDRSIAEPVNSVSEEVARQMARGACRLFGTALAVASTGYAEPDPTHHVAEPFACWALVHVGREGQVVGVRSGRVECPGRRRTDVQQIVAEAVLAELVTYLRELP